MRSQPPCMAWAEKLALRQEDLAPADRAALAAHIQTCPVCAAAQADYHFLDSRLRALPLPALKPLPRLSFEDPGQDKITFPTALVARLILAALLLFGMQSASNNGSRSPGTAPFTYDGYSIYHGHSDYVDAVSWSPDGQYIASGSWDGTVQVWSAHTGVLLTTYKGHNNVVSALAWSPDGKYIAAGDRDTTVRVWEAFTNNPPFTYKGHTNEVSALAWSPNGQYIASASYDGTVQIWKANTGVAIYIYKGHTNTVAAVAWSPDGQFIASGSWDHTVQVWNFLSGKLLHK